VGRLDALSASQIRRRVQNVVAAGVAEALSAPAVRTDRIYFLALSEYERRRHDPLHDERLAAHELSVSSQNGEDGIIQEILRRTGLSDQPFFVEFGVGHEGNAILLADLGWSGLFIEAEPNAFRGIAGKYAHTRVQTRQSFVTPENVEQIFEQANVPTEPDLVSIDIDGGDYWVWSALTTYRPRVIVIEYNAGLSAVDGLVQERSTGPWRGTDFFGASLGALITLGESKGYRLVHTDTTGVNAFFVRKDLPGEWMTPRLAGPNYALKAHGHPADDRFPAYVEPQSSQNVSGLH
jgi:hypothetical protein